MLTDDVLYHGFIWHLCPLVLADQQFWVLVSGAVGLIQPLAGDLRASVVEDAVVDAVLMSEPDTDAGAASVSLKHRHMTWRVSDKAPAHVGIQLKRLQEALGSCENLYEAYEAVEDLNEKPLKVGNNWIKPRQAMEGLMQELADEYDHYVQTTPFWKRLWYGLRGQHPWVDR